MLARLGNRPIRLFPLVAGLSLLGLFISAAPAAAAEEEKEEVLDTFDPNQPKATAGGVYSLATYPLSEVERTLILPQGVAEVRADIGIDMSKGQTFETWTLRLFGRYALSDTFELQAGVSQLQFIVPDEADNAVALFAGVELALAYDLIDLRAGVEIPVAPDFLFNIVVGLPVKFRISPKIAIVALEKIITIHTSSPVEGADVPKPDLTISVGGIAQIMEQLAIILRAEIILQAFETDAAHRLVPLELDLQYTLSNMFDLGLGLRLENFLQKDPADKIVPFDNRSLLLFARVRFGQ
jgi:hypothetical protein